MVNNNIKKRAFSKNDIDLLDVINTSYLSIEDIKWLKSRRWVKRFLKIYARELKKRNNEKKILEKNISKVNDDDIEVLDFTQSIKLPPKEVIEILDFTRTIDISNVNDIADAQNSAKKKVKFERFIWSSIITISSMILIILLVVLINWCLENRKTNNMVESIYEVAKLKEVPPISQNTENNQTTNKKDIYENISVLEADFDALKKINPETVGWIMVPGTKINYPFVKTNNNDYYLKHSFDKTSNKKGWVFLDYRNDIDNLYKNTIIYAHGLVNNQMFGSMRNVLKQNWYKNKNNHIIKISTPYSNQLWQVFSTYTVEPESYYITTYFNNDYEYEKFIQTIKSRSAYDYGIDITKVDKILTLSSCYDDKKRMVLHAKLISYEKK